MHLLQKQPYILLHKNKQRYSGVNKCSKQGPETLCTYL